MASRKKTPSKKFLDLRMKKYIHNYPKRLKNLFQGNLMVRGRSLPQGRSLLQRNQEN